MNLYQHSKKKDQKTPSLLLQEAVFAETKAKRGCFEWQKKSLLVNMQMIPAFHIPTIQGVQDENVKIKNWVFICPVLIFTYKIQKFTIFEILWKWKLKNHYFQKSILHFYTL